MFDDLAWLVEGALNGLLGQDCLAVTVSVRVGTEQLLVLLFRFPHNLNLLQLSFVIFSNEEMVNIVLLHL